MDDDQIRAHIEKLEEEERALRADEAQAAGVGNDDKLAADRERLAKIKLELDQQWDFLRRRQAARDAGQDPDRVQLRDQGTVEGYLG